MKEKDEEHPNLDLEDLQEEDEEVVVVVRARKGLPKSKRIVHSSDGKLSDL
jgi:hypothetical protein